jgi:hypothetical protein
LVLDEGELNAKADNYAQDQPHDEEFKQSQSPHRPIGPIEDENEKNIYQSNGTASYQRDLQE